MWRRSLFGKLTDFAMDLYAGPFFTDFNLIFLLIPFPANSMAVSENIPYRH